MKTGAKKNIIIATSGTGGHIYPGIALAKEFTNKGYNSVFFINNNSISIEILKNSGFEYVAFNMIGIPRKISFSDIKFLAKMGLAFLKALWQIVRLKPVAAIGTGGYITVPVIFAAKTLCKKTFIHEQNTIPGKANILLSRMVDKVFLSFPFSKKYFNKRNVIVSGYPIRRDILFASKKNSLKLLDLKSNVSTVLVFGGSLGSVKLNEIACKTFFSLTLKDEMQLIHITGASDFTKIKELVKASVNYKVFAYMHDMASVYAVCDIVVARCGAGSVFELKTLGKPAILVPYPYATDNHQYWNAKEIEEAGKAVVIEEKNLTEDTLCNAVASLNVVAKKPSSIKPLKLPQEIIYEEIKQCIKF